MSLFFIFWREQQDDSFRVDILYLFSAHFLSNENSYYYTLCTCTILNPLQILSVSLLPATVPRQSLSISWVFFVPSSSRCLQSLFFVLFFVFTLLRLDIVKAECLSMLMHFVLISLGLFNPSSLSF